MAQEKDMNRQAFVELEYLFSKYYNEHIAKVVSQEYHHLDDMKKKEYQETARNTPLLPSATSISTYSIMVDSRAAQGEWNRKNADDLFKSIQGKLSKDGSLQHDMAMLVTAWRTNVVARIGEERYAIMSQQCGEDLAEAYVKHRFDQMTMQQLAKYQMPKSTAEYILKEGLGNSLYGMAINLAHNKSDTDSKIEDMAREMYGASSGTKIAAGTLSFVLDGIGTGGYGLFGKGAVKGGAAAAKASRSLIPEAVTESGGVRYFSTTAEQILKMEKARAADAAKASADAAKNIDWKTIAKNVGRGGTAGLDGIGQMMNAFRSSGIDPMEGFLGVSLFGDEEAMKAISQESRRVKGGESHVVAVVAPELSKSVKVPYSQKFQAKLAGTLWKASDGDGTTALTNVRTMFDAYHIKVKDTAIPKWMLDKEVDELIRLSAMFTSTAISLKRSGKNTCKLNGKSMSYDEICQRGYDYARAAEKVEDIEMENFQKAYAEQHAPQRASQQNGMYHNASQEYDIPHGEDAERRQRAAGEGAYQSQAYGSQQSQSRTGNGTSFTSADAARSLGSWSGVMKGLGLEDFGAVNNNLGYVLATLPDVMINMLTGRSDSFKLTDNMFSLAAIFGGMMVKNPLLKLLLVGLGGASILNRAAHASLGQQASRADAVRTYRQYDKETLDKRIVVHKMVGNTLVADIDGRALMFDIDDDTVDAYERGALPLENIANQVLKHYDAMDKSAVRSFDKAMSNEEDERRQLSRK